jgi:hypothetical protein
MKGDGMNKELQFDSWQGQEIFLFYAVPRLEMNISLEVKRSEHEVVHSPPSRAEIKNACSCTSTS